MSMIGNSEKKPFGALP